MDRRGQWAWTDGPTLNECAAIAYRLWPGTEEKDVRTRARLTGLVHEAIYWGEFRGVPQAERQALEDEVDAWHKQHAPGGC